MKKTHLLTIIAVLLLAVTQISCNGGGGLEAQSNQQVNTDTGTVQEGSFGFGVLYKTVTAASVGNQDLPVYMDLGLNPTTVPESFTDMLQLYPDEYILYPQDNDVDRYVRYNGVEEVENDGLIGDLVDGDPTPIATLNDFQDNKIKVVYFGGTDNNEAFASFTMNFDTNTWSGIILGIYNVDVSGSIEGQFLYSETITDHNNPDIVVSGTIAGSFYGPEVDDIAGVIDIIRNGKRIVDLFDGRKVDINLPLN